MIASDLIWRSASDQRRLLDAGEVSAVELTRAYLTRMDAVEPELHCHLHRMDEIALAQAAAADKRIREGDVSPMTGISVSLKDVLCTVDAPTTAASRILEGYVSPYDATVVERLRRQPPAGAAICRGRGQGASRRSQPREPALRTHRRSPRTAH